MLKKVNLAAHAALLLSKVLLRLMGYKRTSRILTAVSPVPSPDHTDPPTTAWLVSVVRRATTHRFFGATCLERSMATWWLLRWKRIPTRVCIGARHGEDGIEAHAWLEQKGRIINDDPARIATYAVFPHDLSPDQVRRLT